MPDSRYRITERVAAGGMAEVFRGVAESIQGFRKNVAIKRVLPALTKNKKFVAMFLDEARLSLHLQHANIVRVFDIGHADETYFIVMEYVDGVDLKNLLEWRRRIGRPLTIGQTVYIIMEVCKGLAYAHDAVHPETGRPLNIVHRDVSPPNVLLSRNGEVQMTDFGLAKAAVQAETTDPGVVKGKMSYLSPEAARGEEVDRRADIFSVGILLYEMLTGKRLFYGESDYQTVELVRAAKIPPISAQNPEVEPELEEIVRKALARRCDDRFQNATDVQDALAHYLFSRGLKMIQRDIAELVRTCLDDLAGLSVAKKRPKPNVIDTLLQDEIQGFTSVDFQEGAPTVATGMPPPLAPPTGGYIDPRAWMDDTDWLKTGKAQVPPGMVPPGGKLPLPGASPAAAGGRSGLPALAGAQRASVTASAPTTVPDEPRFVPTPEPERLADVLEPAPPVPGSPSPRKMGRGLVIGVLVGALVVGVAFAAWLVG